MDEVFLNWALNELGRVNVVDKETYGDQSTVYKINTSNGEYFLKIAEDLTAERDRLNWLEGKLPVPKVISFARIEDKDVLLLSAIEGKNLATLKEEWTAEKLTEKLAEALRRFHTTSIRDCPFGSPGKNKVLVHGDACLPNFIFHNDTLSGYVDLGDACIGDSEIDLAAAVWSLQYNIGRGHEVEFLKKYNAKNQSEKEVQRLKLEYEKMQKKWFPEKPLIYFITGVCGVGKTAVLHELKRKLPKETYDFHDLDERGYKSIDGWRLGELNYFKEQAEENLKKGITTFISGFSAPAEIFNPAGENNNIKFILLHADPETIKKRIFERYPTKEKEKEFTKKHNKTVKQFADENASYVMIFKKNIEPYTSHIIDTSNLSLENITQEIINKEIK